MIKYSAASTNKCTAVWLEVFAVPQMIGRLAVSPFVDQELTDFQLASAAWARFCSALEQPFFNAISAIDTSTALSLASTENQFGANSAHKIRIQSDLANRLFRAASLSALCG